MEIIRKEGRKVIRAWKGIGSNWVVLTDIPNPKREREEALSTYV